MIIATTICQLICEYGLDSVEFYNILLFVKIDGRCIGREALDSIRADAMARIAAGEKVSAVMKSYGLCRTTAYKWTRKLRMQERDATTLLSAKRMGRPSRLTGKP